jgi:hypothetical protein
MQSGIRLPSRAGQAQSNLTLVPPPERIRSSYDAEYVVLAKDLNCRLLTFDRKLLQLFPEVALKPGS